MTAFVALVLAVIIGFTFGGDEVRVEVTNRSAVVVSAFTLHTPGGKSAAYGQLKPDETARGSFSFGFSEYGPVSATVAYSDGGSPATYLIDDYIDSDDFNGSTRMRIAIRRDDIAFE